MGVRMRVLVDIKEVSDSMNRLRQHIPEYGTELVSEISAGARDVAYRAFFNKPYSVNNPNSLNLLTRYGVRRYKDPKTGKRTVRRGPAFTRMTRAGRVDRMGRRLVNFALDTKMPFRKVAKFTAYPLNLYENDVTVNGYRRPGTHIMLAKIPPAIQGTIADARDMIERKIVHKFEEGGNG